jgi:predicted nucleic acid-binding protein
MDRSWVFDSSPLIILGRIGRLDLVSGLQGNLFVPHSVKKEILAKKPFDPSAIWLLGKNCPARIVSAPPHSALLSWDLGDGESEAISHALRHRSCVVVLDDRRARRCAKAMGVQVKGTIGLLLWLKKKGKLDRIKPILALLSKSDFRLDPSVFKLALKLAGEQRSGTGQNRAPNVQEPRAAYRIGDRKAKARKKK